MRFLALIFGLTTISLLVSLEKIRFLGLSCRVVDLRDLTLGFGFTFERPLCITDGAFAAAMAFGGLLALYGAARIVLAGMAEESEAKAVGAVGAVWLGRRKQPVHRP